jgi:broad specificity phosphatase PhoE
VALVAPRQGLNAPMDTRWWWIRHAPVPDGGRIYGQRDLDCDCTDAAVFDALARELPRNAVWITSNLARARQTAAAIRSAMNVPRGESEPLIVAEFAEQHLGDWQGLDRRSFLASRRHLSPHWFAPASERAPNGESFIDVVDRVRAAMDRLREQFAGRDIVVVAHGGTIRASLSVALSMEPETVLGYAIDNCSLTRLHHLRGSRWRLLELNRCPWKPASEAHAIA